MKNKIIIALSLILCFMQVQAKESLFKELDINKFKTELILLKQQTEKEYSLKNQGIDEEIISVLSSFNSAMYKSIKSDVSVTPITQTKYSVIRSATKKHEYIKHYTSQLRANNDIAEKQAYFRKTAAILNYLKGYDRNISYQIKSSLLSRAKAVVQRGKANDFKGAYYLAEGLSKDFYKYVKLS